MNVDEARYAVLCTIISVFPVNFVNVISPWHWSFDIFAICLGSCISVWSADEIK